MQPRVTFIVPCYNYGRYIAGAIDSRLNQTLTDLELIVIDDASTDETPEVLAHYAGDCRVRVIQHEQNIRHIQTYNEGLSLARGRYVGILSADDYCLTKDAVARQVEAFESNPRVGMVYTAHAVVENDVITKTVQPWPTDRVHPGSEEFRRLIWGNYILHSGTLLRSDVQAALGPYDPELPQSGDWDLWLRAALGYDVAYLAEPAYAYRFHPVNMQSKGMPPSYQVEQNVRTLEKAFSELPPDAPQDLKQLRAAVLQHALLQTAWFDVFNGRPKRAWQGLFYALRRRPELIVGGEFRRFLPRLLLLSILRRSRYRRISNALEHSRRSVVSLAH